MATFAFSHVERLHGSDNIYRVRQWVNAKVHNLWYHTLMIHLWKFLGGIGISLGSTAAESAINALLFGSIFMTLGTAMFGPAGGVIKGVTAGSIAMTMTAASGAVKLIYEQMTTKYYRDDLVKRLTSEDYRELGDDETPPTTTGGKVKSIRKKLEKKRNSLTWDATDKFWHIKSALKKEKGTAWRGEKKQARRFQKDALTLVDMVVNSIRSAVTHLRRSIDIYQEMSKDGAIITGGVFYIPGKHETVDNAKKNIRKQYPNLKFHWSEVVKSDKNGAAGHWHEVTQDETLAAMAENEKCRWQDIVSHDHNDDLRKFYIISNNDPAREEVRTQVPLKTVGRTYIPSSLPRGSSSRNHEIINAHGHLHVVNNTKTNYIPEGVPIWIPTADEGRLCRDSIPDCDVMIDLCQEAADLTHHINKFRTYLLPTLNLSRMYLDMYDDFSKRYDEAHFLTEKAVLGYMQYGDHTNCKLTTAVERTWYDIRDKLDITKIKRWFTKSDGKPTDKHLHWKCIRKAWLDSLKHTDNQIYTTGKSLDTGENETLAEIAERYEVPVQALVAHNMANGVLKSVPVDRLRYDEAHNKWEIIDGGLEEGTILSIPWGNMGDQLIYGPLSVDPQYQDRYYAKVTFAEVPSSDIRTELDAMIESFHSALEKNRKEHERQWADPAPGVQRYRQFMADLLHRADKPDKATRIEHLIDNKIWQQTVAEKVGGGINFVTGCFLSSLGATVGKFVAPAAKLIGLAEDSFATKLAGWGVSGTKAVSNFVISKIIVGKVVDADTEKTVTRSRILDFARERVVAASELHSTSKSARSAREFKFAAKTTSELFSKVSRHFHRAYETYCYKVHPYLDALEANEDKPDYGLTGCRDCYNHMAAIYELQHHLDKVERYLIGCLSLVTNLHQYESYLSQIDGEIRANLDESAGEFIAEGDHSRCHKRNLMRFGKRGHCYGPDENDPSKPLKPLNIKGAKSKAGAK